MSDFLTLNEYINTLTGSKNNYAKKHLMGHSEIGVTLKDKPVDNEKYAFRCFLLRLGFIGEEYKEARKILLKNLTGNGAWKNGGDR